MGRSYVVREQTGDSCASNGGQFILVCMHCVHVLYELLQTPTRTHMRTHKVALHCSAHNLPISASKQLDSSWLKTPSAENSGSCEKER